MKLFFILTIAYPFWGGLIDAKNAIAGMDLLGLPGRWFSALYGELPLMGMMHDHHDGTMRDGPGWIMFLSFIIIAVLLIVLLVLLIIYLIKKTGK